MVTRDPDAVQHVRAQAPLQRHLAARAADAAEAPARPAARPCEGRQALGVEHLAQPGLLLVLAPPATPPLLVAALALALVALARPGGK